MVDAETEARLAAGGARLRPQGLCSGSDACPAIVGTCLIQNAKEEQNAWSGLQLGNQAAKSDHARSDMSVTGRLWVVEVIAPFGGAEAMVADLKKAVFSTQMFAGRPLKYRGIADGKPVVREA